MRGELDSAKAEQQQLHDNLSAETEIRRKAEHTEHESRIALLALIDQIEPDGEQAAAAANDAEGVLVRLVRRVTEVLRSRADLQLELVCAAGITACTD